MGAYWLHSLPDVCEAAGLDVDVWPGWETRSRSSGGYDEVWAVFAHHTASNTSPGSDCAYMWDNAEDRPIGALYLARSGLVVVGAAGATNCQGKGGPYPTSQGTIPTDKGNAYGIAIEAANAGTGEPWPAVQQAAYVTLCAALVDAYGLAAGDVCAHFEWAPDRKIDPAGPSSYATGAASWDMDMFRDDVAHCWDDDNPPFQEDDVTEDDIERIAELAAQKVWTFQLTNLVTANPAPAGDLLQGAYRDANKAAKQ